MEILKSTNRARDFLPVFKAHQWDAYSKYVPIGATKNTGKKTSPMVDFIVSMTLKGLKGE